MTAINSVSAEKTLNSSANYSVLYTDVKPTSDIATIVEHCKKFGESVKSLGAALKKVSSFVYSSKQPLTLEELVYPTVQNLRDYTNKMCDASICYHAAMPCELAPSHPMCDYGITEFGATLLTTLCSIMSDEKFKSFSYTKLYKEAYIAYLLQSNVEDSIKDAFETVLYFTQQLDSLADEALQINH